LEKERIVKAAGIVGVGTFFSRLFGLVRLQVIAYIFGYSPATDAFWIGFTLPNLFRSLLAEGALSTAFIPVFSEWLRNKSRKEAEILASNILNILLLILIVTVTVGIFFAPFYVPWLAFGFKGSFSQMQLAIKLTQIMFPFLLFISIAALAMAILNCERHFFSPAFAPVLFNIAIIFSAVLLSSRYGIYSLAIGVVLGGGVQLFFQLPFLKAKGYSYHFVLSFKDAGVRKIFKLMGPAALGGMTLQINILINRVFASTLPPGGISSLQYAMRLIQLPIGLFAIAFSTAIFPSLSSLDIREDLKEFRETLSLGLRMVFFLLIPSSAGLIIIGKLLISLIFQHGAFLLEDTLATNQALFYYSVGLFAMGGVMVLNRAFYSLQDMVTPLKISFLTMVVNVTLNFLLISPLRQGGLALATSISMIINMAILLFLLRKRLKKIEGGKILLSLLKVSLSSSIMIGGIYLFIKITSMLEEISSLFLQIIQLSGSLGIGIGIFSLLAYFLKLEEFGKVRQILKKVI